MNGDFINAFEQRLFASGLKPRQIIIDGQIHRFAPNGRGDEDGWYVAWERAAAYGNWATGLKETFVHGMEDISREQQREMWGRIEQAQRAAEKERFEAQEQAAQHAVGILAQAQPCFTTPYSVKKNIVLFGDVKGNSQGLLIPLRDRAGKLWNIQTIADDGTKRFMKGGRKKGCYFLFGDVAAAGVVLVAEGYATAASLHQATGKPVVVAFDAGNIDPVVGELRRAYQKARIVICGDDDRWKPEAGNAGRKAGDAAAQKYNATAVYPVFKGFESISDLRPTDFNDLASLEGLEAVKGQVEAALKPVNAIRYINLAAWAERPDPQRKWIVPDWLMDKYVTGFYGDGGVGKSTMAQQLATACALGGNWLGLPVEQSRVYGVFCEDSEADLVWRQRRICESAGVSLKDAAQNMRLSTRLGADNVLMNFPRAGSPELTQFYKMLLQDAQDYKAKVIILDTAADLFAGNENDRGHVRTFIQRALGNLSRQCGAAVLLCAHPSVAGLQSGSGSGGSTAWNNTLRSRWYLKRPKDAWESEFDQETADRRVLTRVKSNYARAGEKIELTYQNGVFMPVMPPCMDTVSRIEHNNKIKAIINCLRDLAHSGQVVKLGGAVKSSCKASVVVAHKTGIDERFVDTIIKQLHLDGAIEERIIRNKDHKPKESLVPADFFKNSLAGEKC